MASSGQSPAGGAPAGVNPSAIGPLGAVRSSGNPVPQQMPGGNNLAGMFMNNQGYGGGGSGVTLPNVTQPTRQSLGLPATLTLPPRRSPPPPVAPPPQAPNTQQIQQRISQLQPNTPIYSQNGGVNAMDANAGGKAGRWAEQYLRMKYYNPAAAQQMLENSPYKSIFAPVQGAAPQQPYQPSQAALLARSMNERP